MCQDRPVTTTRITSRRAVQPSKHCTTMTWYAGHAADASTKVAAIEAMDVHIVGPLLDTLATSGEAYRVLYLPDPYTAVGTRKHDPTPVPFAACGHRLYSVLQRPFNERNAEESDLHVSYGHELMEYFLHSGL